MALGGCRGLAVAPLDGFGVLALQQGILLQLGLDEGLQLEIGQLQQLDRLLQLGRDDQPLALPDLQPLSEHRASPCRAWPETCWGHLVARTVNGGLNAGPHARALLT